MHTNARNGFHRGQRGMGHSLNAGIASMVLTHRIAHAFEATFPFHTATHKARGSFGHPGHSGPPYRNVPRHSLSSAVVTPSSRLTSSKSPRRRSLRTPRAWRKAQFATRCPSDASWTSDKYGQVGVLIIPRAIQAFFPSAVL